MGYEDTVMENLALAIMEHTDLPMGQAIAIEQAKISFEAGYQQGWNDNKPYLPDANEPWDREQTVFEDGKQAGTKEVNSKLYEALKYIIRELDKANIIKADSIFMEMPNRALAQAESK